MQFFFQSWSAFYKPKNRVGLGKRTSHVNMTFTNTLSFIDIVTHKSFFTFWYQNICLHLVKIGIITMVLATL